MANTVTLVSQADATGRGVRIDQRLAFTFSSEANAKGDLQAADTLFELRRPIPPMQIREAARQLRHRAVL